MLRPLISFVVSWTQSVIERTAETKQLYPTLLTQGSITHRCFWEGGQARCPALSSTPHFTYSRWGSYQALATASQWVRRRPAAIAILEPRGESWRSGLARNVLYQRDKAFVQRAALHSEKCAYIKGCPDSLLYDGAFQTLQPKERKDTRPLRVQVDIRVYRDF